MVRAKQPAAFYVGLLLVSGDQTSEPKVPSYQRQLIGRLKNCGRGADDGIQSYNEQVILFPRAEEEWGPIVGMAVYLSATEQDVFAVGHLSHDVTIKAGQSRCFDSGDLYVALKSWPDEILARPTASTLVEQEADEPIFR